MENKDARELFDILHRLFRAFKTKDAFGSIPRAEFTVLMVLSEPFACLGEKPKPKGITVTELSQKMQMSAASISKLLRVMESKGYINRILDDQDRRFVYIALSEKGSEAIGNAHANMRTRWMSILSELGESETKELLKLSNRLLEIIQNTDPAK